MSRMLSKMNLISVVQQLPKEDVETVQGYVEMIEEENKKLKAELQLYQGALKREHEAIHRVNDLEEVIDRLNFIKNRKNQGASQENINKMAIKFVNSWLKEVSK